MQSEIFQDQLWNFSTAYFTSSRYEVASEDMSQFLKDVSETATENDVHIFSQYNEINNKYLSTCLLYTSPSPRDGLLSRMPSSA